MLHHSISVLAESAAAVATGAVLWQSARCGRSTSGSVVCLSAAAGDFRGPLTLRPLATHPRLRKQGWPLSPWMRSASCVCDRGPAHRYLKVDQMTATSEHIRPSIPHPQAAHMTSAR